MYIIVATIAGGMCVGVGFVLGAWLFSVDNATMPKRNSERR
jgi:hypothetical protein